MAFTMEKISLYIILGILFAIAYSLKRIFLLETQIANIDKNIQNMIKPKKIIKPKKR